MTETGLSLDSPENMELARRIFAAKQVPLTLLGEVRAQRDAHSPDWPAVVAAVAETLNEFNFYFDFVVEQIASLKSLWVE